METQVLIPQEFSLVLTAPGGKKSREQVASVFSSVRIPQNTVFYPFQGTVRIDKLEIHSYLDEHDVSNSIYFHFIYCHACAFNKCRICTCPLKSVVRGDGNRGHHVREMKGL
jgi:hypothetical protein